MTDKIERSVTYKGQAIYSYHVAPCKDGIVFGLRSKSVGDIHLTLFWKDGKIRTHITDKTDPNSPKIPWGQQFTPEVLTKKVERIVRRWVKPRPYHHLRKAWVLRNSLLDRV